MKLPILISLCAAMGCTPSINVKVDADGVAPQQVADEREPTPPRAVTVVEGLDTPWSIAWTPDGTVVIAERTGEIMLYDEEGLRKLATVPESVETGGEGGLMGLALHPNFDETRWIYVGYTRESGDGYEAIVKRFKWTEDNRLIEPLTIIDGIEGGRNHVGLRIAFGPDGKLYVLTGERFQRELAQQTDSLNGKTLRLNPDGTIPKDNPFVGREGWRPEIWTLGHRNAQGVAWQPGTGLMFQSEHGPSGEAGTGGDEINIVEKGKNYGWPVIHHEQTREGMVSPLLEYTPSIAPSGAAFYTGPVEEYKGDLFVAMLRGQGLLRIQLDGREVVGQERLFTDLGRIRAVAMGPDGHLYFSTSNRDGRGNPAESDDRIMRVLFDE